MFTFNASAIMPAVCYYVRIFMIKQLRKNKIKGSSFTLGR